MMPIAIPSTPFADQKPGTSGLRKRVKVFQQQGYTENFVQATLSAIPNGGAAGKTLVVGGDGRYFMKEAIQRIIRICAGNHVAKLIIGVNGIMSTPAVSALIRSRKADGGIILTASHNPGGPDADFGIKYNMNNGGPAPESVTNAIFATASSLKEYFAVEHADIDLSKETSLNVAELQVEIVDPVSDYINLAKTIFDFDQMKRFFKKRPDFKVLFDGMHGVTGPYAKRIFIDELNLPTSSLMNCEPSETFGGGHPDPNLTYAHELVERVQKDKIDFAAASDGDGDRNMILSHDAFVNPSDSVAVIAAKAQEAIPYFKSGLKGLARSMPTSGALDRVAKAQKLTCYEVPTGWKFFGNLMDAGRLSICGEESFGTGSDHIREKDGLWAILAWIAILASEKAENITVSKILNAHWTTYGRNYFSRYDYEEVDSTKANAMVSHLRQLMETKSLIGQTFEGYKIKEVDDFSYTDPIDHSVSKNQGLRFLFEDGSRIIFRLSGTGSQGATIRMYVERYAADKNALHLEPKEALKPLIHAALSFSKLVEFTGRTEPTVIT